MADKVLTFDEDERNVQVDMEDDFDDMDLHSDDEGDNFDHDFVPEEPDDDDFRLDGYGDLGIEQNDEEDAHADDSDCEDTITGRRRKRSKITAPARSIIREGSLDDDALMLENGDGLGNKPSSRVPGTWGRADRKKGETLPAYSKRVSHELDSDDELIMAMRDKGYSDKAIVERLKADGRIRYDAKSISTRVMRIRDAQARNVDFLLKEGYKEWELKDDILLMRAHALADIEVNYEIERIRSWRFRKVSEYMRRLDKDALFTPTACRERFSILSEGTARIPTDMDDDPDARRFEMETYCQAREEARSKEATEREIKEANERKEKEAARTRNAAKSAETAARRQKKEEEKLQRAMQRAASAQVRHSRALDNAAAKAKRNQQIKKENEEKQKKTKGKGKVSTTTPTSVSPAAQAKDPRSYISLDELAMMSSKRGLPGLGRSKEQLLSGIQDADDEYSLGDLKKMCQAKGLSHSGDKERLKYQLALAAARACSSFEAGIDEAKAAGEAVDFVDSE